MRTRPVGFNAGKLKRKAADSLLPVFHKQNIWKTGTPVRERPVMEHDIRISR